MHRYKLTTRDMSYYQDIVDRNLVRILKLDGVFRFGVGYKMINGDVSDDINLIALVSNKQKTVPISQRIPAEIDGVGTDVIGIEQLTAQSKSNGALATARAATQTAMLAGLIPDRNKKFDPITGGVPIRNRNISVNNPGVLGAIVFDRSGKPMGLSAQHAIGDQKQEKKAKRGNPINQPLSFDESDEIGTLLKFDTDYDAALFEINSGCNYEPKMQGNESEQELPFELNEATQARIGQIVECPARRTHTKGCVNYYLSHIHWIRRNGMLQPKKIRTVVIEFLKGFSMTMDGDSGAVWVDTKSKCPVALHSGIRYVWLPNDRVTAFAVGTCMQQVAEWGNFSFTVPKVAALNQALDSYETSFVAQKSSLLAFCQTPGRAEKLVVKKFDSELKPANKKNNNLYPKSGVAVCEFKNNIYASWRSPNDKIQIARFDSSTLEFKKPATSGLLTRRKPSMVTFKNRLVIGYVDARTTRLNVAHCDHQWKWKQFEITNIQSTRAPAMAVFKNKIYICWSDANYHMKLAELDVNSQSSRIMYYDTLGAKQTGEDVSMAVIDDKLCLAYTTLRTELRIIETTDLWNWSIRKKDTTLKSAPPSLTVFDNDLICVR